MEKSVVHDGVRNMSSFRANGMESVGVCEYWKI